MSQFTEPGPPRALFSGIAGFTSIQMLAVRVLIVSTFLFRFLEQIERLRGDTTNGVSNLMIASKYLPF